jgi:murein DD-endopeptidase MepM/ murein hydrolase activator NlpD
MRILVALLLLGLAPWVWPVEPHEVVRAFDAPATPYGPGHRGIDIAAPAGSPVLAPQDGVVRFAGPVAGRPVLSIEHGGGLVSSFEPVEPLVAAGDAVEQGQQIGVLQPGHVAGAVRLHLGARLHGEYIDPLTLLGVERPVLLPMGAPKRGAMPRGGQARGCAVR